MESTHKNFLSSGVSQMFIATFAFFLANFFVKKTSDLPTMEIVFFRCLVAGAFCLIGLQKAGKYWLGNDKISLIMRGVFGTIALSLFFLTVQKIPLASAMTIQYLSPIFTAIIAIFFLGEKVKYLQWVFYAIAFGGVLLIKNFDPRVSLLYLILGIVSAFCSGAAYNIVRKLRDSEHPLVIILYFQIVGIVVSFPFLFFDWKMPSAIDWFYLFLIGVFSQLGQIFLTNAFSRDKAASVAIVVYTGLLYGIFAGWIFFDEAQGLESLVGMLLVVVGVALSVVYSKRQKDLEKLEASVG